VNAVAAPATDGTVRQIRAQQVRLLYQQAPLGAIASLLVAPILVLATWNALPRPALLTWLALLEMAVLVRLGLAVAFHRRRDRGDTAIERWAVGYACACAASGICWGGCVVLLALSPSLVYDTFIALVLGGALMGGVLTMTPVLAAYVAYALPLALPPLLWLLAHDDPLRCTMGATGVLYLLLALGAAHRQYHTLAQSLRLGLENLGVARAFAREKEKAEAINRQLADQQAALQDSVEAMRELYRVISTPRRQASDPIQAMLAMGCQRFGMAIGILGHVSGERYEVAQTIAPGGEIARGDVFALADTYCRDTLRARGPLGFEHASAGLWRQHPCYRKFGLEAYLGVPVRVGDQVYGTLNFSDFKLRPAPFTTVDRELIQLMAQWVGGALEQERMAEATQRQQTLLAHASRLNTLGEMASGLVHEINQPVTAITLYAETGLTRLRNQPSNLTEARETLEKIAAQSARASAIIQRIRRFARQGKPHHAVVRVRDLLDETADFLNLEARRHAVRITYDAAPDLPPVLADPLQIQQVILNLVRNAVDAMGAGQGSRAITLHARPDRETVEIAVQDTGPGLDPELMNQLLTPFFTTKPDGLGLGLPISQAIVEAHGGRLWATPNQGPGVTFHFTLPVATRAAAPERAVDPRPVAAG
jgi:signal transduction histidine kinase